MGIYILESLKLRVEKLESMKGALPVYRDILDVNAYDTAAKIRKSATDAVHSFATPDNVSKLTGGIEALTRVAGVNIKDARRRIADKLIEDNLYKF
jgi:tRNA threonylcarbamoyladenosine modification (KEOPS) complex Cgi121 subunit